MSLCYLLLLRLVGRDKSSLDAPPPEPKVDQKAIDDFLALTANASICEWLQVFRRCNFTISVLKPESPQRKSVDVEAFSIFRCGLQDLRPTKLTTQHDHDDKGNAYVRMVEQRNVDNLPTLDRVFQELFKGQNRTKHPAGTSSLTFAFGSLISLCTSYSDHEDMGYNQARGLLDLSPLYGFTEEQSKEIREYEDGLGLLFADAFFEHGERLLFLPRAVSVLLILFNRNHNYIARQLFKENEQGRWVDPDTLEGNDSALEAQDDEIYKLARRINCRMFRNIVANDFLKGLLDLGSHEGNPAIDLFSNIKREELGSYHVSVEFSVLYNWYAMTSVEDVNYIKEELEDQLGTAAENVDAEALKGFLKSFASDAATNKGLRACVGLERDGETDRFDDTELAKILLDTTESVAAASLARGTPDSLKVFELAAVKQARDWEVCSLNDFRKLLGLPAYSNFNQWCPIPEIANAAAGLYGNIDRLELYPGLCGEKTLSGPGFCLGETMTRALIFDIVSLVRSDPEFKDMSRGELTNWGYEDLLPNPKNEAFGAYLPKLLLRNLPGCYPHNNVWGLFPFTIPSKIQDNLMTIEPTGLDYDFNRPGTVSVTILEHMDQINAVLDDPGRYPAPHLNDVRKITGGHGTLLSFNDKQAHDRDEFLALKSLIPDSGALGRFGQWFKARTETFIKVKWTRIDSTRCRLDLIQDVINAVTAAWAAEQLCGIVLNSPSGYTEKELFGMLLDLNNCIFGTEPHEHAALLTNAIETGKTLMNTILSNLERIDTDPAEQSSPDQAAEMFMELFLNEPPEHSLADDFLARLAASGLDKKELSANTLELAILSVKFAQILAGAVRFYLDDRRAAEKQEICKLATQGPEVNKKIMGYIRESHRLESQISQLSRNISVDSILQVAGLPAVSLKKGNRVLLNFVKAREDEPQDIDPSRDTKLFHGPGLLKFFGEQFVEQTMPEVFKAIFRLDDIKLERNAGLQSALVSYKDSKPSSQFKKPKRPQPATPFIRYICDFILIVIAIIIVYWSLFGIGRLLTRRTCWYPRHYRPWEVYTLLPGPDNQTLPFTSTMSHFGTRRVSFVDADARDMRFRILVNGRVKGVSTNFDVDLGINCGVDAGACVNGGWSHGEVVVPPGKHTIMVEWIGKDFIPGTNMIDWGDDKQRRILWKQDLC